MGNSRLVKFTRVLFLLLNINLIIFSFVLVIFGLSSKSEFVHSPVFSPSNLILALGLTRIVLGAFGLVSVDKYGSLLIFAGVAGVFAITDLSFSLAARGIKDLASKTVGDGMMSDLRRFNGQDSEINWAQMQQSLKCCGVTSYKDWSQEGQGSGQGQDLALVGIPASCFSQGDITEMQLNDGAFVDGHVFAEGCLSRVLDSLGYDGLERVGAILGVGTLTAGMGAGILANCIRQWWVNHKGFILK